VLVANINYPTARLKFHRDKNCSWTRGRRNRGRRLIEINEANREAQVSTLLEQVFGAAQGVNQMWLEVDLQDPRLEEQVPDEIRTRLARRYQRLAKADWEPRHRCG
jgi:hypothetical protein